MAFPDHESGQLKKAAVVCVAPKIVRDFDALREERGSNALPGTKRWLILHMVDSARQPFTAVEFGCVGDDDALTAEFRDAVALTELRALLNLLHEGRKLLSLVLFGLPTLDEVLRLEESLAQRIDIRVEMGRMDAEHSAGYLRHRLQSAGATSEIFDEQAIQAIHTYSDGIPRLINSLADNSLFEGFLSRAKNMWHERFRNNY